MGSKNVQQMDGEKSLNLKENKDRLIYLALKKHKTKKEAAAALGITPRHLSTIAPTILEMCQRDLKEHGIEKDK